VTCSIHHPEQESPNVAEHVIGTGRVQLVIDPAAGSHVRSLCFDGWEVLAAARHPRRPGLSLDAPFVAGGLGGFDECIPSISGEESIPDHGDAWQRAWRVEEASQESITTAIEGAVLSYRLQRRVAVVDEAVVLDYRLDSLDDRQLELTWAAHPLFRVEPSSVLRLPVRSLMVESSGGGAGRGAVYELDSGAIGSGVLRWADLPAGSFLKGFAPWPRGTVARLEHPDEGVVVSVAVKAADPVHLGLWWTRFGYPVGDPVEHLAIEPTFGSSDSRRQNIHSGTGLRLAARASRAWQVTISLDRSTSPVP
jgi:hypothetical protein